MQASLTRVEPQLLTKAQAAFSLALSPVYSHVLTYDLEGYPRQEERFDDKGAAEARAV